MIEKFSQTIFHQEKIIIIRCMMDPKITGFLLHIPLTSPHSAVANKLLKIGLKRLNSLLSAKEEERV
jgi:hypothetical protein